ncbi:23S rRNA (guanine(745)-N(1))-methyltransferase [Morganella psychrotolerans]|uniref:23S rRNA (Guanine(745)-N(1))-methyltransferase n=2 Tax=Morganella psychrotolerans TaxID=368603 RepID=A0A5M9R8V9_9GAMM|nr:23S rRNA (guanine(745)-N(1))-methyltransferase [Morganella psychrotolerans]
MIMSYQCPLCQHPLDRRSNSYCCDNNHQFDLAKEGYINLLPVQFKRSKEPGDSKEMMQARRAFLDNHHYRPMRDQVIAAFDQFLPEQAQAVLDIGCGEGYYTGALAESLAARDVVVYGLDVAKVAVRFGAKRYPQVNFSVASSQRLPFEDNSLEGVLRIYAPCNPDELTRVVKPGGIIVTVTPGPRHLYQLKSLIYTDVHLHPLKEECFPGFSPVQEYQVAYPMLLAGADATALLSMTPFAWKATEAVKTQLAAETEFSCETDFLIRVYRRDA